MELFADAKAVRLKSRHGKFLYADEDEQHVTQDRKGSSPNAHWTVEAVPHAPGAIRLKSRYGRYLAASSEPFLLKGHKVVQAAPSPDGRPDASVEWEPIREGFHVRFKSRLGGGSSGSGGGSGSKYLRANGGVPPWRNSVTHDVPHRTYAQDWVFWNVEVVQVLDHAASASAHEAHHQPTTSHPTPTPPSTKPEPKPEVRGRIATSSSCASDSE